MSKPPISGIELIKNDSKKDERGYLAHLYDTSLDHFFPSDQSFNSIAVLNKYVSTLRGMHYQVNESAETKVVYCLTGRIFDAVIDLRVTSETYLQSYYGYFGPEEEFIGLKIPVGCAHGYLTLADDTLMIYLIDKLHSPENERGISWDDPNFQIPWPETPRVISKRDKSHPRFEQE
jgi:dTDP-4-dehydrorhamnose 3,5-epimerase